MNDTPLIADETPTDIARSKAEHLARQAVHDRLVAASAFEVARVAGLLTKRCDGSGDGNHEIEGQGDTCADCGGRGDVVTDECVTCSGLGKIGDNDAGVRAACVLCGLVIPLAVTFDQLESARVLIEVTRCPGCSCGKSGKKSGTLRSVQGVFRKHTFDCGSELTLTGFNRDGRGRCVHPDE